MRNWDHKFMSIAREMADMSTCIRRHVGCVLVTEDNHILATGFNGTPPGWEHCDPKSSKYPDRSDIITCPGASEPAGLTDRPTGNLCWSNHSEANALLKCDTQRIHTCYTTTSPCEYCIKLLLCTSTIRIVFLDEYPGQSRQMWVRRIYKREMNGHLEMREREWIKL